MTMTQTSFPRQGLNMENEDATKWIAVAAMVLVGLITLVVARQVIAPFDRLATEHACSIHGDELSRPVVDVERSNRFGLINRSYGWCLLGPVTLDDEDDTASDSTLGLDEGDPAAEPLAGSEADPTSEVQIDLREIEPGSLYRAAKIMGVLLQLGAASAAVRIVGEPILDRFVRSQR
jgi:hypothetical protein